MIKLPQEKEVILFRRSYSITGILPEDHKLPAEKAGFLTSFQSYYDGQDQVVDLKTIWGFSEAFEEFKKLKHDLEPSQDAYHFTGLKLVRKSKGNPGKQVQVLLVWRFGPTTLH